jgi:hypothetical protein
MARVFGIVLILGGLVVFLGVYSEGVDRAFGGVFARFGKSAARKPAVAEEPAPRRPAQDWWEKEERPPQQGIGQRVRNRVNDALETGAERHGGE